MMHWFQTGRYVADTARQREGFGQGLDVGAEPEVDGELHRVAGAMRPHVHDPACQLVRSYGHTASQFVR